MALANGDLDTIILKAMLRLGYPSLHESQHKAVISFVNRNDVFIIVPTGSGKSLCFAVLPFMFDSVYGRIESIAIIVSPLIALIKVQVSSNARAALTAPYHYRSLLCTFQQHMLVAIWTTVSNRKKF